MNTDFFHEWHIRAQELTKKEILTLKAEQLKQKNLTTVLDYNPINKINIYESITDIYKNWINKSGRRDNFPSGRIPIHIG